MNYQLTVNKPWKYPRGLSVRDVPPGVYQIPNDYPIEIAQLAVDQGVATLKEAEIRGTRTKAPAPENKMLFPPAENKSATEIVTPKWPGGLCVVAATGPSLTEKVAEACRNHRVIAVNDAYQLLPFADVLYACDAKWWDVHDGVTGFSGERWSSHGNINQNGNTGQNDKIETARKYGLHLVRGAAEDGFSLHPSVIHYGSCSGFQAINLAILFGATKIVLVGFDMRVTDKRHFFGDHPAPLSNATKFKEFIPDFNRASKKLPAGIEIINATPDSALKCFKMADLNDALSASA